MDLQPNKRHRMDSTITQEELEKALLDQRKELESINQKRINELLKQLAPQTKKKGKRFYAVFKGKTTGIFETWVECCESVNGVSGAMYAGFPTREDAENFMIYAEKSHGQKMPVPAPDAT